MLMSKKKQKHKKHINYSKETYFVVLILMFVIPFLIGWHSINQYESKLFNEQRSYLKKELVVRTDKLAKTVNHRFFLLQNIQSFVSANLTLYESDFQVLEQKADVFFKTIQGKLPGIKSISIFPRDAQHYIYPESESYSNKRVKNLSFFEQNNNLNKTKAISNKHETIVSMAIYQDGLVWGLTSMTLDTVSILTEANLQNIKNGLLQFALKVKGGDIFYGVEADFKNNPIIRKINMPDCQWEIAIVPSNKINQLNILPLFTINFLFACLISCFSGLLYVFFIKGKNTRLIKPKQMTSIQQGEGSLDIVFQALPDLYFRTTKDGTILDYRVSQIDKFYVTSEKFLDLKMQDVLPHGIGDVFEEKIKQYFLTNELQTFEYFIVMPTGRYDYEARLSSFQDSDDLIIVIREVTERKKNEELIWYQANYDILTKLPNRRMLHEKLEQEIIKARQARPRQRVAILFIDLDRFKDVNDSLGHDVGDLLLIESAKRIINCIRDSDIVSRFGGDEYIVMLTELDDLHIIERIAQNIINVLSRQFLLDNNLANISASIGISIYPNDAKDVYGLLKKADQAMYRAKSLGRSRFSFFTKSMQQTAQFRLMMLNDMKQALEENQFQLYYQPIIDLTTNRVFKAEALLRWNHPKVGMVMPDTFISLAEETGFIVEIGNWVFREATRKIKEMKNNHGIDVQISINKSPVQFQVTSDHDEWVDHMRRIDLPGKSLMIEITESLLIENDQNINKQLDDFRKLGVQIALDDFGTGFSSLSYLKRFDIDFLKLDQIFIKNLKPNSEDMILTEAIIMMAHKLGLMVVAEGIETEQQRHLLIKAGCDYGQGYLISKPLDNNEFTDFLKIYEKIVIY